MAFLKPALSRAHLTPSDQRHKKNERNKNEPPSDLNSIGLTIVSFIPSRNVLFSVGRLVPHPTAFVNLNLVSGEFILILKSFKPPVIVIQDQTVG